MRTIYRHPGGNDDGRHRHETHKILIVDDVPEMLDATRMLLTREGHVVRTAASGAEGLEQFQQWNPDLVILDYFMPGMNADAVVEAIREADQDVQIVLQTGYASEAPPRDMLRKLDIQGYHDKTEGPEKLLLWVDASLKTLRHIRRIRRHRRGLQQILEAARDIYLRHNDAELLSFILDKLGTLLEAQHYHSLAVKLADGEGAGLEIVVGTGRFSEVKRLDDVPNDVLEQLENCLRNNQLMTNNGTMLLPLSCANNVLGVIYLESRRKGAYDAELLRIFAMQVSQALEIQRLFSLASEDDVTHVFLKKFFFRRAQADVQAAARMRHPLSLCLLDIDHFADLNENLGMLGGDAVLREMGSIMLGSLRAYDFVGRLGSDQFVIGLPYTDSNAALQVVERLRKQIAAIDLRRFHSGGNPVAPLHVTCGLVSVDDFTLDGHAVVLRPPLPERVVDKLLAEAERRLFDTRYRHRGRTSEIGEPVGLGPPMRLRDLLEGDELEALSVQPAASSTAATTQRATADPASVLEAIERLEQRLDQLVEARSSSQPAAAHRVPVLATLGAVQMSLDCVPRERARRGDIVHYTFTIQNNNERPLLDVVLQASVPAHTAPVPGSARLGDRTLATRSDGATTCFGPPGLPLGTVRPGDSLTLSYALRILPGAEEQLAHRATVHADGTSTHLEAPTVAIEAASLMKSEQPIATVVPRRLPSLLALADCLPLSLTTLVTTHKLETLRALRSSPPGLLQHVQVMHALMARTVAGRYHSDVEPRATRVLMRSLTARLDDYYQHRQRALANVPLLGTFYDHVDAATEQCGVELDRALGYFFQLQTASSFLPRPLPVRERHLLRLGTQISAMRFWSARELITKMRERGVRLHHEVMGLLLMGEFSSAGHTVLDELLKDYTSALRSAVEHLMGALWQTQPAYLDDATLSALDARLDKLLFLFESELT